MKTELPVAVLFDWDGTLVDSLRFLHGAHNHVRKILGIEPFTLDVFRQYFGQPREILYKKLYADFSEQAKTHFESYVLAHHLEGLSPMPGAQAVLDTLLALGIPCGVVSNKKTSLIVQEIENFGWSPFFRVVVGAGDASADKPSPEPLLLAARRMGLESDVRRIWFVGDTENDVACAQDANALAVFIEDEHAYAELSQRFDVALYFNNCLQFNDFLLQYS